jgi:hypothetical protein
MQLRKKEILSLLREKKYRELAGQSHNYKKIFSTLISLSYDKTDPLSWRAIESLGLVSGEASKSNHELVRNLAGRLLWMIRDESGGIGWSAPEMLGEVVRNNPELCADIAPIIVSFHEEKMLTAGVIWAVARMGKRNIEMVDYAIPIVINYLQSRNHTIRGYAAYALGEIGTEDTIPELEKLRDDDKIVSFYEDGELKQKTIKDIAEEAIRKLLTTDKLA